MKKVDKPKPEKQNLKSPQKLNITKEIYKNV